MICCTAERCNKQLPLLHRNLVTPLCGVTHRIGPFSSCIVPTLRAWRFVLFLFKQAIYNPGMNFFHLLKIIGLV